MQYTTVLDASEESFKGIEKSAREFEDSKILAAIHSRHYDQEEIVMMCAEVKIKNAQIDKEYIALDAFSKSFNKLYATDYNKCYETALSLSRKVRSSLSGAKKIFKKMCPVVRKTTAETKANNTKLSVFDHSYLTGLPYSVDLFGLESYDEFTKEFCLAARHFFLKLMGIMLLCRQIIEEERYIKTHPELCHKIYLENFKDVSHKSHDTVKAIKATKATLPLDSMTERMHGPKSLQQAICECFHAFNPSQFQLFVIHEMLEKGKKDGLSDAESLLWPDNHDMAKQVRFVIQHFDELDVAGRLEAKINKRHIKAKHICMLMEWAGIKNTGKEAKFVKYFHDTYQGKHLAPPAKSSGVNSNKNKYTVNEYTRFANSISDITKKKKDEIMIIPIAEGIA